MSAGGCQGWSHTPGMLQCRLLVFWVPERFRPFPLAVGMEFCGGAKPAGSFSNANSRAPKLAGKGRRCRPRAPRKLIDGLGKWLASRTQRWETIPGTPRCSSQHVQLFEATDESQPLERLQRQHGILFRLSLSTHPTALRKCMMRGNLCTRAVSSNPKGSTQSRPTHSTTRFDLVK